MRKKKEKLRALIFIDENELMKLKKSEMTEENRNLLSILLVNDPSLPKEHHLNQTGFAEVMGVHPSRVNRLVSRGILTPGMPWRFWAVQHMSYLKGVAAGRSGTEIV